jgi:hypothetical protein
MDARNCADFDVDETERQRDGANHVFGEIVISCTGRMHSMEALEAVGAEPLRNTILIDVSNPLQRSLLFAQRETRMNERKASTNTKNI